MAHDSAMVRVAKADATLAIFGSRGDVLRAAARFVAERKS
jgi:farnesyl diphosphate synthase